MSRNTMKRDGFTLVELLVSVSLLIFIALIVYSGFRGYVAQQQFEAGVTEVHALLQEARDRTLAAEDDVSHGVHLEASSVTLFTGVNYSQWLPGTTTEEFNGLTITPSLSNGTTSISFARLTGVPTATGTILLTSTYSGATSSITILGTGIIE